MDEPLGWECKVGLCGLCAVQIVEGADNFAAVDPGVESKLTGGKLPIERLAALKLGGECPPNGGGVLLRRDVTQRLRA